MAKSKLVSDTWPARDAVLDEDRGSRVQNREQPGEHARKSPTRDRESRQPNTNQRSHDTDPDSADAEIDRDDMPDEP
jgi:hypothetical protein